jgi:hypothetical protein
VELFIAQNHSAMTHLPVAAAIMVAACALAAIFTSRGEVARAWAILSIAAFVTVLPAIVTGVAAGQGRFNADGKAYIQSGVLVSRTPSNERIWRHQVLGAAGTAISALLAALGISVLKGRNPNKYLVAALALALVLVWAIGAHIGGEELWGSDTFPAFK